MSSSKRARVDDDVDFEHDIEVESASSSFRTSLPQKRARLSLARENGGSVVSDEEDAVDMDALPSGSGSRDNGATANGYGIIEDDDDYDDWQATQAVEKQMRQNAGRNGDNMASEQGVIEEVFCRNFMCHSKLRVGLGPNINFIIGHNGSGKSAVLTALQMTLGGKAQATNRATNLKGMIKEGEESATIAVKIKNRGDDAYRPALYGESITVERHFSRAGTSGFRIKSDRDKVISTKRADLDDILDFFAFQLDNPINVLTQDNARQFLSNSSAAEKYKFFIRGTQLEALDADYKLLEERLDNTELKLQSREEDVKALKHKADEAERRKKARDQMASLEDKIKRLQWMHAWAQVEEIEQVVEKGRQKVEEAHTQLREKEERAQDTGGIYEGHNQAYEAARRTVTDLEEQLTPVADRQATEKETFDDGKKKLRDLVGQQRMIKDNMKEYGRLIKQREADVALERDRLAGATGPEHAERLSRLEELKVAAASAKDEVDEFSTGRGEVERKLDAASRELEPAKDAATQARALHRQAEDLRQNMERQRPDQWAAYRPNMSNLVRAVRAETRWRSQPVGPMGMHVKLLDDKWMSPVERTFGGSLESFVVLCKEDSNLLLQIMRRVNCQTGVIIGNANRIDTTGKEPEDGVSTILRVLDIDDDAVRNQLIINHAIDQTVLIHDRDQAMQYMYDGGRKSNVKATICFLDGRHKALRLDYTRSGGQKTGPVDPWNGPTRMKSDHENQTRIQRENVELAKREVETAESQLRQLTTVRTTAVQEVARFKRRHQELVLAQQRAEDAIENLQSEIDSNLPQDGKLQELERQLADAQQDLGSAEGSYQDSVRERDAINDAQREVKDRLDAVTEEVQQVKARLDTTKDRVKQLELDRTNALREHNLSHQYIDEAKKSIEKAEASLAKDKTDLAYMEAEATKITPQGRVPVDKDMTPDVIDRRLGTLIEEATRQETQLGGTREELTRAYHAAVLEFQGAETQMKSMEDVASELKKTLDNRQQRWMMFRRYISARARSTFQYLLSERQFRGRILMSHHTKELDIKVEPDLTKRSDAGREAKTLSGGEKSFSTICLLLSIWDAMGSPIRCLDEFDVFMDSVNRATSMSMMIGAARRAVGRQFILITPQAMNNVELGPDVRIHRMSDPERGQQTLSFE